MLLDKQRYLTICYCFFCVIFVFFRHNFKIRRPFIIESSSCWKKAGSWNLKYFETDWFFSFFFKKWIVTIRKRDVIEISRCLGDDVSVVIRFFRKLFWEQPKNQFILIGKPVIKKREKVIFHLFKAPFWLEQFKQYFRSN